MIARMLVMTAMGATVGAVFVTHGAVPSLVLVAAVAVLIFYCAGLGYMGGTGGALALIGTVLLAIISWPLAALVVVLVAMFGTTKAIEIHTAKRA